ncbi:putative protein kinase RLK-Pelle-LRR-III family [Helianthus annuus]|nr:putative protein kinase RLK-Pelle-LRR-III family [Helianthus annuus]KAJ0614780.1 putative protein kinase RLK-Pelle-LRR-III family [Helianthus annuus]
MEIFKIFLIGLLCVGTNAVDLEDDKRALLDLMNNLAHSRSLNWDSNSTTMCNNWTGVTCSEDRSRVIGLRLPGVGFHGHIPANTISRLSALQILSLRSSGISGLFPVNFVNLKNLSLLYLQFNQFSGPLPLDFSVWKSLTIVNLSNNKFNGSTPSSTSSLTHLPALNLANNSLSGQIPDLDGISSKLEKGGMSPGKAISRTQDANNRLVFFQGCNYAFDLEELLRASAEVLCKGTFGMLYKAILEDGTSVVVKRLKDLSVGKREFEQQMGIVGSIKHENVIELRAYYYSKDEKLTVCEYYGQGSVAAMLHGMFLISLNYLTHLNMVLF